MPWSRATDPEGWSEVRVLFDDGHYRVIAGRYQGHECLGACWRDAATAGAPAQTGAAPNWHRMPLYLTEPVLHGLLDELLQRSDVARRDEYIDSILREIELLKTRVAQV